LADQGPLPDVTKAYFYRDGTVHTWWSPESPDNLLYEHFREQLRWATGRVAWPGQRVLDIGTGKGRFAISYALNGAQVTALDISREMLRDARAAALAAGVAVQFCLSDAEALPFPPATFDVVSCMEAIMHFPQPVAALQEMARVVKPEGVVLLSMTNRYRLAALARWPARLWRRLRRSRTSDPPLVWDYSLGEFRQLLAQAGLVAQQTHGQGLLQATARVPLGRGRFLPLVPRPLADWFFSHVEPSLRETPLLALMGTIMVVCHPGRRG